MGKNTSPTLGCDGDQLVQTETLDDDDSKDIGSSIYEPNTFIPLVRLSTNTRKSCSKCVRVCLLLRLKSKKV
jgi:hypothetical protein